MNDNHLWAARIKTLRLERFKTNQQAFADFAGVSLMTVSCWERRKAKPDDLSVLIVMLLESVLNVHPIAVIVASLRTAGPQRLSIVRMLAWLERQKGLTRAVTSPPSWSPQLERESWAMQIKGIRGELKVNQQTLASLIGYGAGTLCGWAKGEVTPSALGKLILELLSNVLKGHSPAYVLARLRETKADRLVLVRALAYLERHPTIPQLMEEDLPQSSR